MGTIFIIFNMISKASQQCKRHEIRYSIFKPVQLSTNENDINIDY